MLLDIEANFSGAAGKGVSPAVDKQFNGVLKVSLMNALDMAIRTAPTMAAFAKRLGVTPQVVANWKKRGVPVERVLDIERVTKGQVNRHALRPDIYPPEDAFA